MDMPRRKPIPGTYNNAPPAPHHMMGIHQQQQQQSQNLYTHSRSRTTSSNIFPTVLHPPNHHQPGHQQYPPNMQVHAYTSRRTPSQHTFSTYSSGNAPAPSRQSSQDLRRSTSGRSANLQPTSYVALMRKQKATVWCDRSQPEDPRLVAAQKAAKARATKEMIGGGGRLSSSGSASLVGGKMAAKIQHSKTKLVGYTPGDLIGGVGGVPMRLSASEVENGDSDDDADSGNNGMYGHHRRTGSGWSSVGSGRRGLTYHRQSGASSTGGRWSSGNSPPGERQDSMENVDEAGETPMPNAAKKEYFAGDADGPARSMASGSSGERADGVGELGSDGAARLASNSLLQSTVKREKSVRNPEELRRRGSVDERTMTMSAGRLYIANPDADSD